jgi:hypothetical protein
VRGTAWWKDHPAYPALVEAFRPRTQHPENMALVAIVGLQRAGFEITDTKMRDPNTVSPEVWDWLMSDDDDPAPSGPAPDSLEDLGS